MGKRGNIEKNKDIQSYIGETRLYRSISALSLTMVITVVLARAEEGTVSTEENLPPGSKQTSRKGSLSVFSLLSLSSTQNNP